MTPNASRAPKYLHRVVVSVLLVAITGMALRFLDLPIGLGLFIVVVQVAGYNVILTLMGGASPEKVSETLKFVLAALGGSLLWGAALLAVAYNVAR